MVLAEFSGLQNKTRNMKWKGDSRWGSGVDEGESSVRKDGRLSVIKVAISQNKFNTNKECRMKTRSNVMPCN